MQPIPAVVVHRVQNVVGGIQPDEVEEGKRADGVPTAEPHRGVDVLPGGVPFRVHGGSVIEVAEEEPIRDESGAIADLDHGPIERIQKCVNGLGDGCVCRDRRNEFHQVQHRCRIEEVGPDDAAGTRGRHGEFGDPLG